MTLERPDVTLHGWIVNADSSGPLIIYFGGNAEEVSRLVDTFAPLEASTVLMNYRGYGRSGGRPTAAALLDDARALVEEMPQRLGADRPLILFGRSLGSGIAAQTTRHARADGVILLSPYRSLTRLAQRYAPGMPARWLLRHRIDTTAALDTLPDQVLVFYSPTDLIIPADESRALIERLEPPPRVVTFDGGHNMPMHDAQIWPAVEAFVAEAT
ncbi:MAG: alpha/beta fold hydrolase [Gammaproteobacteria bacterium]|nr:alpha/beta fold hydrolase [Gammaproteobacteria bacterium]